MLLTPVFDTSAIVNLSKRGDAEHIWNRVRVSLPKRGCPLSFVTVLELFHGLNVGGIDKLDESVKALVLACRISRRRVLLAPYPFIEKELFGITDERHERSRDNVKRWLGIIISPDFKARFRAGALSGMRLEKVEQVFSLVRNEHSLHVEEFLTRINSEWRRDRQNFGSSLPETVREEIKRAMPFSEWKSNLPRQLLAEMHIDSSPETIDLLKRGCDAYFTFTVSLLRDSLLTSYQFERNSNDFHDGLQLAYLCRPSFCLVTDDRRSILRVGGSSHADRIFTVDQFLSGSETKAERAASGR
jgi:hypothetical protein